MSNVQTAGIASLAIDGIFMDVAGNLTYSTNATSKEGLIGQSGPQGYKTSYVYGMISANFRDTGSFKTNFFEQLSNVSVTCQLANGKTVLGVNMFCVDVQTTETTESTIEVKFNGTVFSV